MKRFSPLLFLSLSLVGFFNYPALGQRTAENIGTLMLITKSCSRNLEDQAQGPCSRLVLDQLQKDVISLRFIARGKQIDTSDQLTFAGTSQGSLQCKNTRCALNGPLELELSSLSEVAYNRNGVAEEMPKAWPVLGSCKLEAKSVSCKARSIQGQRWEATASF